MACGIILATLSSCTYDRYLNQSGGNQSSYTNNAPSSFQDRKSGTSKAASVRRADPSPYYRDLSYQLVTVQPGDTLSKIAARYDTPTPSVIALNRSAPPYVIYVGQQVKVPHFKFHRVKAGETLYAISRVYDVSLEELVHFNDLEPPYGLRPATVVKIPQKGGGELRVASVDAKTWPVTRSKPTYQKEQIVVTRPKVTKNNKDLSVAKLPDPEKQETEVNFLTRPAAASEAPKPVAKLPQAETVPVLDGNVIPKAELPPLPRQRYSIKHPPNRSGRIFSWPVKGKIISGYGRKNNGLHNDGINIAVKKGTPVKAAENGIVSYVGNEMRSFGNLILISHSDGYVTTYGHASEILVRKGDIVRKGDVIARAGESGDVETVQLHFEIRKKGTALNPRSMLAR
ncbi:MAG: LysM peptidoglycan-binding domain-containing M23 family metallopeptidase [Sneathiellales bacterium]|nr:LysM peptidoglycan-binding domain-containing M23 family metallopeptidase [Sneathiellales bacterium]